MANPQKPVFEIDWTNFNPQSPSYTTIKRNALDFARSELDTKKCKAETLTWFSVNQPQDFQQIEMLEEWRFQTLGLYYWVLNRGANLDAGTWDWINSKIQNLLPLGEAMLDKNKKILSQPRPIRVSPAVRDQNLGNALASDLEDLVMDGWNGDRTKFNDIVLRDGVTPKILSYAGVRFQQFVDEILSFRDDEILDGFRSRGRYESSRDAYVEMNNLLQMHITNSRTRRKGSARRTGKVTGAEKRAVRATEKVNYRKEDNDLGVVSLDPSMILGSQALLVFNTKDRKIGIYHAANSEGLMVKGTTIQNYDEKKSVQKTLRKPQEQIQSFHKVQKRRAELVFSDYIRAKSNPLNGRINANTVLLAVWK